MLSMADELNLHRRNPGSDGSAHSAELERALPTLIAAVSM
jgi:hypothetical protein